MLTLREAAEQLGVQPGVLRRQIHLGKLKARKIGRDWTITKKEAERYQRESLRLRPLEKTSLLGGRWWVEDSRRENKR